MMMTTTKTWKMTSLPFLPTSVSKRFWEMIYKTRWKSQTCCLKQASKPKPPKNRRVLKRLSCVQKNKNDYITSNLYLLVLLYFLTITLTTLRHSEGYEIMKCVLILLIFVVVLYAQDDDRLTINRLGYGVFFERIGEISDAGGIIYHPVTWSLIIPEFKTPHIELMLCNVTDNEGITGLCTTVNNLIARVNNDAYTTVSRAKRQLEEAIEIIPLSDTAVLISRANETEDVGGGGARSRKRRSANRQRRDVTPPSLPDDVIGSPDASEIPDWIKDDNDDINSNLEYLIPGRFAGELFTNIFNMPSSRTIKNTERNLKSLGNAIYTNKESIVNLGKQLGYIMQLTDKRLDAIEDMATIAKGRLLVVRDYIREFQETFYSKLNEIEESIFLLNGFKSEVVSTLYPELNRVKLICNMIYSLSGNWLFGIINLTSGFISEYLVSQKMIEDAILDIEQNKLSQPGFRGYKFMSKEPGFYYKLPRISYARAENKILITIEVPLYKPNKKLTLYRVNDFPLPVTAGLEGDKPSSEHGYTYIVDLPPFLAVSENLESYIEMTEAQYLACEGAVKGVQNCGNSVGVPRMSVGEQKSCVYAIYSDSPLDVKKFCDTAFTKDIPQGSARQLSSDSSFLIQSGGSDKFWTMRCPASPTNPYTKIEPCSLCRLKMGCGCTLIGPNFRIPTHISGCDYAFANTPTTTKIFQRNVATITQFVTDVDLQTVRSYAEKVDELWPEIEMGVINFTIPDHFNDYVEKSRRFASNFSKGAELIKKKLTIFKDKQDNALAAVRNYTDQEVDRAGSILGGLESLFTSIFGGKVWAVLAFVFSAPGLAIMSLVISAVAGVPLIVRDCRSWRERKREEAEEDQLLLDNQRDVRLDAYSFFWPKAHTQMPAMVTVIDDAEGVTYQTPI
uniref:p112 n=1 Tax=Abalone herpesvirus Victoria/AUS/2007 TaxID=860344 RepID=E3W5T1_9VIRU|nr:p112 [Abalone herpesvirus Victoria/AUS/2007]